MKRLHRTNQLTMLIFLLALVACSSTKSISDAASAERDGSTKEKAIMVKSINAEYEWIRTNYPGSQIMGQALISSGKKHYDLITFATQTGETKKTYFDINSFFGKF